MIFDSNVLIALIEDKAGPDLLDRITRLQTDHQVRINAAGIECVWRPVLSASG